MNQSDYQKKLAELSDSIDELYRQLGLPTDDIDNEVDDTDEDDLYLDEEDDEFLDDEEFDGACGVGVGFDLSKLFDPKYNEHVLSEPDENGMVEISDELYDRLYGKYHSKEDMLSDIIRELEYYLTGKYAGDEEYWAETRYLAIDKESNRPLVGTMSEIEEEEDREFDIYDIDEFEQCFWTNANDRYADYFDYKLADDSAIRNLIDKYYPNLSW